jgi:hypothetical protein
MPDARNVVATDYEAEHGDHPVGWLVHIVTVTYAYRGVLEDPTPTGYWLREPVKVFDTDELGAYAKTLKGSNEESLGVPRTRIERGCVVEIRPLRSPQEMEREK